MKKFSFSMQKILDVREFTKKQAEAELGKAVAAERKIQDTLDLIAQQKASLIAEADNMHDLQSLYDVNQYFKLLDQRRDNLLPELAKAKVVSEEKRDVMREAMKKVKVLENLKDSRYKAWKKEALKEDETVIDDIVTSRFGGSYV